MTVGLETSMIEVPFLSDVGIKGTCRMTCQDAVVALGLAGAGAMGTMLAPSVETQFLSLKLNGWSIWHGRHGIWQGWWGMGYSFLKQTLKIWFVWLFEIFGWFLSKTSMLDIPTNVNTGLKKNSPPPCQKVRRSRRFSIDFEVTNPPQIKRHLGLRTTGQLFPTQQENYCDWPIPKWGCLIGGGLLHTLIIWGGKLGRIQKTWFLAKRGV